LAKQIDRKRVQVELGASRVNAMDLLGFLADYEGRGATVTAENNDIHFDSVQDIKDNILLFCGWPEIDVDRVRISLSGSSTDITLERGNAGSLEKTDLEQIAAFFRKHFDLAQFLLSNFSLPAGFLVAMFAVYFVIGDQLDYGPLYNTLLAVVPMIVVTASGLTYATKRQSVYYNPRETFFQKHGGKIIASIATAALILAIQELWNYVF